MASEAIEHQPDDTQPSDAAQKKNPFVGWLARWGFAILVAVGAAVAGYVGRKVSVPEPVPNFALTAAPIYRAEIGGGIFLASYLAAMAFVLALHNRGFSEIGMRGLKAQDMANRRSRMRSRGRRNRSKRSSEWSTSSSGSPRDSSL